MVNNLTIRFTYIFKIRASAVHNAIHLLARTVCVVDPHSTT